MADEEKDQADQPQTDGETPETAAEVAPAGPPAADESPAAEPPTEAPKAEEPAGPIAASVAETIRAQISAPSRPSAPPPMAPRGPQGGGYGSGRPRPVGRGQFTYCPQGGEVKPRFFGKGGRPNPWAKGAR